jgi:uncharacterized membrane protein
MSDDGTRTRVPARGGGTRGETWIERLREEAGGWADRGFISAGQRDAILELYGGAGAAERAEGRAATGDRGGRAILIFSILGSLLVGAGVILYFAANWPKFPWFFKVGSIFVAVTAAYWAGYRLERGRHPILGRSLIFLGAILYGAGIWLIAQVFHLSEHYPNGFLFWGLGVLPMVAVTGSRPILYLATATLTVWTVMEQASFGSFNFLYPMLLAAVIFPLARRHRAVTAEAAAALGLFLWFSLDAGRIASAASLTSGLFAAGQAVAVVARSAILYGAALWVIGLARVGAHRAYLGLGAILTLGGTYALTFGLTGWVRAAESAAALLPILGGPLFVTVGALVFLSAAAAASVAFRRREAGTRGGATEAGGPLMRAFLLASVAVPCLAAVAIHFVGMVPRMVIFNLLLFALTVGLIALGILWRREALLNLGLVAFVLHIFTRYVDVFFRAADRALFFVVGGTLLLAGGWLIERNRQRLVRGWGGDGDAV